MPEELDRTRSGFQYQRENGMGRYITVFDGAEQPYRVDLMSFRKPEVVFGVSPSGRLVNTRHLYADPARWAKAGTVDYFAPQIYWSTGRDDEAEFGKVLLSWKGIARGIPVYVGLAAYKHDEAYNRGQDAPYMNLSEFGKEVDLCRNAGYIDGHIWFRAEHIAREEIKAYILSELYGG